MDAFSTLRSGQKQLGDELLAAYKRMTDPEERKRARIIEQRDQVAQEIAIDAGL